ncbi:2-octaprenyl-3-methyl-6-methoxy-1,4-benzoquinol hydroxylase [Alteromonas sp. 345S023]|uniref:2-octaprenyl-3-methyl-6-methoxy-1,4-benzoquinol hydroxylase n=1 Tax=Alteromonas profundi TaxID=2696062 RepID=A0A7X5LKG5_9ALTE|nr:FAD-dependent monooxygenase [Alteromonas profundi]NDV91025.1 2-octaprenyl-3-methyl-6-methoxy-1,4-benzoquinol hydroxylase [Alteromonas profundi]
MYDFCINGGGMVGAALALGLAQQNYKVAIIELNMPDEYNVGSKPDLRVSAISEASVTLLRALGAWKYIAEMRVKPYTGLSVWDNPAHRTDFTAQSIEVPQLGFFVENRLLQLGCHKALQHLDNVTWYSEEATEFNVLKPSQGASVTQCNGLENSEEEGGAACARITFASGQTIDARWVIGADGAMSKVRKAANIGTSGWQYQQQAMGITVEMAKPVPAITWQQFTPSGPKAFLPMFDNYASLVWYDTPDTLKALNNLNNEQLAQRIMAAFPDELGNALAQTGEVGGEDKPNSLTVIDKACFPLTRAHATRYVSAPYILIGDAAHTINPLAGQGVNLGFRDVESLLAVTANKHPLNSAHFIQGLTRDYERPRQRDNRLMMSAMDGFYGLFSNDIGPIKWLRNQLLSAAQRFEPAKREVLKYAIGMREWKF